MTASSIPTASGIPVHCAHHAIVSIDSLIPLPGNPQKHPERQLQTYAEVIVLRGWRSCPIVSRLSGHVIAGNGAIEAARRIPVEICPVEYQDYKSEAEELADSLAHNHLPELAVTDEDLLKIALAKIHAADPSQITGYSAADLEELLAEVAPDPLLPICARLNEEHNFLVVYTGNVTDWQFLKNLAGVRLERSYKNSTIGEGRVVRFEDFIRNLRANVQSINLAGETPGFGL